MQHAMFKHPYLRWLRLAGMVFALAHGLQAQTTSTVTVQLRGPDGSLIPAGRLMLENRVTGFRKELFADGRGVFTLSDVPPQSYRLMVEVDGFQSESREISVRGSVPVKLEITLALSAIEQRVNVNANAFEMTDLVDPVATGMKTQLSATALEKVPISLGTRGMEAHLLTFPGFAMNANGAIHPRGAHNQMTFVVDGLPISDQMTGAFATALDPNIVDGLELYTGDIPAEYGAKVSGVATVTTRSGLGSRRRLFGNTQLSAGAFDTLQNVTQAGGETGKLAWFTTFFGTKTNRYLDQVSLDNLHNGGNSERAFIRMDYQLTERDWLRFNAMAGRSSFQLANLRSQHAAGASQRQLLRDAAFWLRWNRVASPSAIWETTLAYRPTIAQLFASPGDTPVTASQSRHLTNITLANRLSWMTSAHNMRLGFDVQHFPLSENFSMGITSPEFNNPLSPTFNDALLPHDLTRGGRLFQFSRARAGSLYSGFIQDSIKWDRFVFSLGVRYDNYRFLITGSQFQPRLGVAYHLRETGTVFRASYNRNYQTPPNENLLLSNSEEAGRLAPAAVREALGNTWAPMNPQQENVYELGIQQALFGKASLNGSFFHKDSRDLQDNNNFLDTGIIFPVTLAGIRVNGVESRLTVPAISGISGTLSATHSRAIASPPFTGGLFLGQDAVDLLSQGPFVIDHDQKLSLSGTLQYSPGRRWWASTSIRYDSGLVANPSDPVQVAADPDYYDLLPYVKLGGNPSRVKPRTITDIGFGLQGWCGDRRSWDLQLQVTNLFNRNGLYNFQSVFVGTRLIAPRAAGVKLRWFW